MHQLVLASQSPRREQLLREAGFFCQVNPVQVSEIIDKNLNLADALKALARKKAQALVDSGKLLKGKGFLVVGADTVVVLENQVLGKPKDYDEAQRMLAQLSDREHSVITALAVLDLDRGRSVEDFDTTKIRFRKLETDEIAAYVKSGEPMDKAGSYALQGAAAQFVIDRRGSWSNVVGFPLELFERMIGENGWQLARNQRS